LSFFVAVLCKLLLAVVRKMVPISTESSFFLSFLLNYYRTVACLECPFMFQSCILTCVLNCIIEELGCCFKVFLSFKGNI
jgi:hypothetical protein